MMLEKEGPWKRMEEGAEPREGSASWEAGEGSVLPFLIKGTVK